ncbi:MAG: glycoside hydrolase family 43 protein [Chitinispirillaceae bacterium]|nr:glycoside hydrolase family 43 protein [Chitinispirillaceae bacterium]
MHTFVRRIFRALAVLASTTCMITLLVVPGCDVPGRVGMPIPVNSVVDTNSQTYYLFTYFINLEEGLGARLALSSDGINFHQHIDGRPILAPLVGVEKLMRDPTIYFEASTETFHMVWTCGWNETGIGYSSSKDLKNWTPQRFLPVGEKITGCACCWAPEIFYDDIKDSLMIFWSTEVGVDGKRAYYVMTKDFQTFSDPAKLFDPGYTEIDAQILKVDEDKYYMFFKDERTSVQAMRQAKNIHYVYGPTPQGPWSGESNGLTAVGYEGPCAIIIGDEVRLYSDPYMDFASTNRMYAVKVADLDASNKLWPVGPTLKTATGNFNWNHSSIIEIPRKYVMHLVFNQPL